LVKYVSHRGKYGAGSLSSLTNLQNGRYAVLKKLGEGGKGVVYKARDTVLNRIVAIKVLKTAVAGEEGYSRFMREAQAVGKLNHPNIVSIHDIGREDDKQFFVLEFVDGMSLQELMGTYPEGKCDIQTALRIAMDVCGALQYAHAQGILHRDIKPENVMLTREDTAKLMDFGLAKMLGQPSLTQEGIIVGTVAYVAPEIALGRGADVRSDLYSFGAVLYEAVTGKPPFVGEDAVKVIFSHIHDFPVPPSKLNPKVPQALSDCIVKLLEKEPEKRFQTAADLLKALRDIAEGFLREAYGPSAKAVVIPAPRPIAEREIQLIDRTDEMTVLREAVDKAVRGEGGLAFLHGEPGIGKTRLTREVGAYARLRGMQVVYGRCPALFRMDGVPPYVLWSEVIRNYLEDCNPEQLYRVVGYYPGEVCKLVPDLANRLRSVPPSVPISPEHERDRLFEAVSQFVTNISREAPLLVVLDDLQWTDQSSLLLMHYLARGAYRVPMFILGAYRDTDIDERHVLTSVLTELNRERLLKSVLLERMPFDDVSEMTKRIFEQDDVPREFCELVYDKTRGNPFFVEEVIKSLKEEKVIYRRENQWKIKEVSKIEFPKTVKSVIKARIVRLDDECQNLLTLASFVGNDFSCEAMCGVSGIEENKLLEIIDKLLKTGLIKHRVIRGEDVCSFGDIIVRDVVYEEVNPFKRKKLHRDVGCALEKVYEKKIDEHFGELALHFLESGDEAKALDYFLKAGDRAAKIYANNEAVSYFQRALPLLEKKEGEFRERARILERLGSIKRLVGEYDACMRYWNDALALWKQAYEKADVARLHRDMANVLWRSVGDATKAKEHYDSALAILQAEPESVELANLYADMTRMYYRIGNTAEAFPLAEKALELSKRLGDFECIAKSYFSVGTLAGHFKADFKKGRECLQKALKIALDNGYVETALSAYYNLAGILSAEDYEEWVGCFEKGFELAKKVGHIEWVSVFGRVRGNICINAGNMSKGIQLFEESVALDRKTGNRVVLASSIRDLGYAYQILGEWDKSGQYYNEALDFAQKLNDFQAIGFAYAFLGWFQVDQGDYIKARELYEKAREVVDKAESRGLRWLCDHWLTLISIELGEIEKAKTTFDNLYKLALELKEKDTMRMANRLKATLLRAQKKWDESIECFEQNLQDYESVKARQRDMYWFAKFVLCEYARVYLERNQEGDRERAHNILNQALEMFQKMGAKKDIEKILAKKKLLTS
jgi:predicted ATPase/tRNA A-37 threonylcarbamoyl transferase component Bud32